MSILILIRINDVLNIGNATERWVRRIAFNNSKNYNENIAKLVLIYTPYFEHLLWPINGLNSTSMKLTQFDGKPCSKTCFLTYNKTNLAKSDAVLFHHRDLPSKDEFDVIMLNRSLQQRWIYYGQESPRNIFGDLSHLNGIFNWTITYSRESDIVSSYGSYRNITPQGNMKNHIGTNYGKEKEDLIAWTVSHCGTTRDNIVSRLTELLPVSIYGRCASFFPKRANKDHDTDCPKDTPQCAEIMKTFKFYLSFENGLCLDYITEKYWTTPLDNNMVPIVFGLNYDKKNSIPGSYISISDFSSIESLANHIKYLDKNDTAYNEYFQWKSKYERKNPDWVCQLCENLYNDQLPSKVYVNLKDFWAKDTSCLKEEENFVDSLIDG